MILYILRHGIAEDAPPGGDDGARKLTARGREKIRDGADGMRALKLKFDVILTSPLARATETAETVAAVYAMIRLRRWFPRSPPELPRKRQSLRCGRLQSIVT